METLILDSKSKKDVILLLDIAKRIGLNLKIASKRDLIIAEAKLLDTSIKSNKLSMQEIVDECRTVRKTNYEKRDPNSN